MKTEKVRPRGVAIENLLPCTTQHIRPPERSVSYLHGITRVCSYFLGDNKTNNSLNRQQISHTVFPAKAIPPVLWNASDCVLQYNFKKAHIAYLVKSAADFISKPEQKIRK